MQCYTELLPPTAATHAVALPFLHASATNLVIAKTSLLQVFELRTSQNDTKKLNLIGEYPLSGTVTALATVKTLTTKTGGDALILALKDAKLSLIEWDADNHRISTISIHLYEGENIVLPPFALPLRECRSILTVDPSSRCAALKFGERHVAILPFRQTGDELGEGLEDEELDVAPGSTVLKKTTSGLNDGTDDEGNQTPYKASFVLPLTALDPVLSHPVDLAFLHEYREPAFGILSAPMQTSAALLDERKDILHYSVFSIDIEQRASTSLVSIPKLPSDLWKVVPLPLPVGGALLVGTNEFVHVDQGGKANAVAVNEFAKLESNFGMVDQSNLNMKLENCAVEILDATTGDLVIALLNGSLAILGFTLVGRNVGGLHVTPVADGHGGNVLASAPSCIASLTPRSIFVGSEEGDSALVTWQTTTTALSRKRSHAQMLDQETNGDAEEDEYDVDEDDLYAPEAESKKQRTLSSDKTGPELASSYHFSIQDHLPSLGPINSICIGRCPTAAKDKLELRAAVGRGAAGRFASLNREIKPMTVGSIPFSEVKNLWNIRARPKPKSRTTEHGEDDKEDELLFAYNGSITQVYDIVHSDQDTAYTERTGTEFEHEGETLSVSTLSNGSCIVHCQRSEIRVYDSSNLSLEQIIPMVDEQTDAELKIIHTSSCDPHLFVLRDDSSVAILSVNGDGDVEPLELAPELTEKKWLSGCLFKGTLTGGQVSLFLLGQEGGLHVFSEPNFQQIYTTPMLSYLPAVLSRDMPQRRLGGKETLTEILMTDIGDEDVSHPYLVIRNATDDLTLYEPFLASNADPKGAAFPHALRFRKVPFAYLPKYNEMAESEESEGRPEPLRSIQVGRYTAVCIPGPQPSLILRESFSLPRAIPLTSKDVKTISPIRRPDNSHRFAIVATDGSVTEYGLPAHIDISTGWSVQKVAVGSPPEEVRHVAYHDRKRMYVVATCRDVDFHFSEDDGKHLEQDDIGLRPQIPQYTLHLVSAATNHVIHSLPMPAHETVTSLKVMPLELSEHTREQDLLVVAGTAALRGEDMPAKGAVNIYTLQTVVPDPDVPESEVRLHLLSREETRGAVTAVESFPGGLVGVAQGMKIMIRGLKEDRSCLPVAFLDAQTYISQLKFLDGTGMWLAGDAWKGVWFGGFTEEPYKLTLLGKSRSRMEVVAAEFLPFEGGLFLVVVDAEMDLHILQYDPENPKSLNGTRLLHRGSFHLGHFATSLSLVPSTLAPMAVQEALTNGHSSPPPDHSQQDRSLHQILTTSLTGSIGLLTPLDEGTYRRLGALQTHLTSILEHAGGLNPRAYRSGVEGESGGGGRGVLDGSLLRRVRELGSVRRAEVLARAGMDAWTLRGDEEVIGGGGLGYL